MTRTFSTLLLASLVGVSFAQEVAQEILQEISCIRGTQGAPSKWFITDTQGERFCCSDQSDYRGEVSEPINSGDEENPIVCLNWLDHYGVTEDQLNQDLVDSGIGDHNKCRNPKTESVKDGLCAFCYTDSTALPVQCCDIGSQGSDLGECMLDLCNGPFADNDCDPRPGIGECRTNSGGYTCRCQDGYECADTDCTVCQEEDPNYYVYVPPDNPEGSGLPEPEPNPPPDYTVGIVVVVVILVLLVLVGLGAVWYKKTKLDAGKEAQPAQQMS